MGGVGFAHVGGYGFHLRWGEFANVGFFCNVYCFSNKMVCVEVFFYFLDNFCGKKPPCCEVLFVRVGIGAALQVYSMDTNFFFYNVV